ncbi:MAG: DedA family protein [Candidatus Pacearchaeota archaeon]|jgi:membrane-associated protein
MINLFAWAFNLFDFVMHIDKYLGIIITNFGYLSYAILFLIIFLETGLVLTPFLPGDSLIFISGAFAGKGDFNLFFLWIMFSLAAILGDSLNYWIGNYFGANLFSKSRFFKKEYLDKTKEFYVNHGGKTIILARFIPIVRTFAPFVAGIGKMDYKNFLMYNLIGGLVWVSLFLLTGYYFGKIPWVEENLSLIIIAIIFLSVIPVVIEYLRSKKRK